MNTRKESSPRKAGRGQSNQTEDVDPISQCAEECQQYVNSLLGASSQPRAGTPAEELNFDRNTPHYRSKRMQIIGIVSLVVAQAMIRGDSDAMDTAFFIQKVVLDHFDEYYVTKYPSKVKWL